MANTFIIMSQQPIYLFLSNLGFSLEVILKELECNNVNSQEIEDSSFHARLF